MHRGAVDADGKTGDGAGIHIEIPYDFFVEKIETKGHKHDNSEICLLYTSPSPRDGLLSRMPSSA